MPMYIYCLSKAMCTVPDSYPHASGYFGDWLVVANYYIGYKLTRH